MELEKLGSHLKKKKKSELAPNVTSHKEISSIFLKDSVQIEAIKYRKKIGKNSFKIVLERGNYFLP